ncbi:MAG: aspartate aminotransferase family protein [Clostridiales bacterium]|nr:aspartate aminotransferase family protein [Clostridiales bacterium]
MNTNEIISLDQQYIMPTYGRLPIAPKSGKNATMVDADGKTFIDFTSGIGVNSLGYCDENWIKAITAQLNSIQHMCNYYYCENAGKVAEQLIKLSGMAQVFFGNSGAEANEGAIKLARKYSYDKYGAGRATIVSLESSFHGRTITTLAATGQDVFHQYFYPFTEGFKYVPANDFSALEAACTSDVCAIIAEPIQGEGGVNVLEDGYVQKLRKYCDEHDILLIFDEVQTGIGRTGKFFAHEYFGIKPDIMTLAKGLGGGLPIGVFIGGEKVKDCLGAGMHGTTFGSNPVVCAGALEVIARVSKPESLDEINKKGEYFRTKLLEAAPAKLIGIRGKGMMIGVQTNANPKDILHICADNGLLVLTAGKDVVRLLPPLTISYEEIDAGLAILIDALK